MKHAIACLCLLSLVACGGATPRDRYVEAVKARAEGDNKAYYDAMVELAHEAPDTRVGRRARANLNTGMLGSFYWLAVLGSLVGYLEADAVADTLIKGDAEAKGSEGPTATGADLPVGPDGSRAALRTD